MKAILLSLLLMPIISIGQTQAIPSKANQIIVKGVTFAELCSKLLDAGYLIEKKDTDLQTVKTEPKIYPKGWNAAYKIYARVKDTSIYISATLTAPWSQALTGSVKDPLWRDDPSYHHTNKKGVTHTKSLVGMPFMWANEFALSFGKPVEYKIQ